MRKYTDLIYYKDDVVNEYTDKRKSLEKKDVEDLLRCALLFLEKEAKKKGYKAFEIPNIGVLHKKLDLDSVEKVTKRITIEDNFIAQSAYIDTSYLPIVMRRDMIEQNFPGIYL